MRVVAVRGENYGSLFGPFSVGLADRGLTLVEGKNLDEPRADSNGAGKSTIFDALDWCLFGVVPKGDHVDSVINDGADYALVEAVLEDAGLPVVVTRRKERGKACALTPTVAGQPIVALDLVETQAALERVLGLDREVFHATVLYGQNDVFHFADTTSDTARIDVLTKILQLGEIDVWEAKAKEKLAAETAAVQTWTQRIAQANVAAATLENTIKTYQEHIAGFEQRRAADQQALVQQAEALTPKIIAAEAHAARLPELEHRLFAVTAPAIAAPDQALAANAQAIAVKVNDAMVALGIHKNTVAQLEREIRQIETLGVGACPTCKQQIGSDYIQNRLATLKVELHSHAIERDQSQASIAHLQGQAAQISAQQEAQRLAENQAMLAAHKARSDAQALVYEAKAAAIEAARLRDQEEQLRNRYVEIQEAENPVIPLLMKTREELAVTLSGIEGIQQNLDKATDRATALQFWEKALSAKGLKSYILDHRLQELTDAANQWVKILTGGTFWVRFETQTLGRSTKKLSNKINVRIFQYRPDGTVIERNYRSYSGGQKKRISWAIDFGLSRLIAARSKKDYNLLVLDEVFKHVDAAGGQAVVDMLKMLRQEKNSIFVIEHDSGFKSQFENVLTVQLKNGRTTIAGVNDEFPSAGESEPKRKIKRRAISR